MPTRSSRVRRGPASLIALSVALFGCAGWDRPGRRDGHILHVPPVVVRALAESAGQRETALPEGCRAITGYRALGTVRRAIATCSVSPSAGPNQLRRGGMSQRKFSVLIREGETETIVHTYAALRSSLAPIEDAPSALAIAAWALPLWEIPSAPIEASPDGLRHQWHVVNEPVPAPQIDRTDAGWRLQWPIMATFGCDHTLWFITASVDTDGTTRVQHREEVARDNQPVCVD